ncbi:MAG: hypothetical protein CBC55_01480 [Gammaproteobacteria bacterium TMED95]|nr:MAG: hypothetical protein CBC55_01480 [Gammaproteobacteria bacterium TMED95]
MLFSFFAFLRYSQINDWLITRKSQEKKLKFFTESGGNNCKNDKIHKQASMENKFRWNNKIKNVL